MDAIDKVRILVVGDSGVGKSSLVHLICHNEAAVNPGWTIGCSLEVKLHEYKEGTPDQKTFFLELWDIGGSSSHKNTRAMFYHNANGLILVHDLTNRKSHGNLKQWLNEILDQDKEMGMGRGPSRVRDTLDPENLLGSVKMPILVIGTKQDLAGEKRVQRSFVAEDLGVDDISLNCHNPRSLAPGSGLAVKLTRFFDRIIESRYYRDMNPNPALLEKRRLLPMNVMNAKSLHGD
ncbi:unnamed protein product [Darwinula stevensoni]|uniref:Rab-like protein 3 n=1 Tax=Darwinula stevensoni TaxID=69355 RepID=A0A7R9A1S2_9CRUS|nr:unnamed protein product [Darwinula stevensoni]CAG0878529.1 unnamed protein product [Darwinula stevensoni]